MSRIVWSKESMEEAFLQYLEDIFKHPEIISAAVKEIVITRGTVKTSGTKAFEAGFHDLYSDTDLSVKACIPNDGSVTPEE